MLCKIVCIDLVIPKAPNPTLIYLNGELLSEKSCKTVKSDVFDQAVYFCSHESRTTQKNVFFIKNTPLFENYGENGQ